MDVAGRDQPTHVLGMIIPRNSGTGLKRIDHRLLRPGDIILVTSTSPLSASIKVMTWSDISHAMICVQNASVIDATGAGVHAGNTQRLFLKEMCPVYVLRVKGGLSADQLDTILTFARGQIGTSYSTKEAIRTWLGDGFAWSKKQFCSRLVAQAYAAAGIALVADPNYCSPKDLKKSRALEHISDATVPVTAEEALWAHESDDLPQRMRDAITDVLDGAREHDPTVETFDDLHALLVARPELDQPMCERLRSSGYLTLWKDEQTENSWQYNLQLLNELPSNQAESYSWQVLRDESAGPNRFIVNRGIYSWFVLNHGFRFFQLMADLYERLAVVHQQRVMVATAWLETNGLLAPEAGPPPLVPHSKAWFAALDKWDPPKALMTRMAIDAAGSVDVCSICGDDPASDYRLEEKQRPPGGVDTIRLCAGCLQLQSAKGEAYAAI